MEILYFILSNFFPLLIVGFIVYLIARANSHARTVDGTENISATSNGSSLNRQSEFEQSVSSIMVSKEDAISQVQLIISIGLLGLALLFINYFFAKPITSGVIGFVVIAVTLGVAYYFRLLALAIISVIALFFWWGFQANYWAQLGYSHVAVIIAGFFLLSCLYCALGYAHRDSKTFKRLTSVYLTFGIIGLTCLLIYFSTQSGLGQLFDSFEIPEGMHGVRLAKAAMYPAWQILVSMAIGAVLFIIAAVRTVFRKTISMVELASLIAFAALAVGMLFINGTLYVEIPKQTLLWGADGSGSLPSMYASDTFTTSGRVWAILLNLALLLEALVFLFIGYMRDKAGWVNLATGAVFVILFVKYIDWFYDSLDKEYFFIGAGVLLLLIGGAMEKGRRFMIERMKHN